MFDVGFISVKERIVTDSSMLKVLDKSLKAAKLLGEGLAGDSLLGVIDSSCDTVQEEIILGNWMM